MAGRHFLPCSKQFDVSYAHNQDHQHLPPLCIHFAFSLFISFNISCYEITKIYVTPSVRATIIIWRPYNDIIFISLMMKQILVLTK